MSFYCHDFFPIALGQEEKTEGVWVKKEDLLGLLQVFEQPNGGDLQLAGLAVAH